MTRIVDAIVAESEQVCREEAVAKQKAAAEAAAAAAASAPPPPDVSPPEVTDPSAFDDALKAADDLLKEMNDAQGPAAVVVVAPSPKPHLQLSPEEASATMLQAHARRRIAERRVDDVREADYLASLG